MGVGSSALHAMPATSHTRVLVAPPSLTSSRYQNPVACPEREREREREGQRREVETMFVGLPIVRSWL
eukprot:832794-Rhodomonas_salina.2